MFIISCPYCGEREQSEFKAGGEAHIERPKQPTELSDDEWAEYLFMRKILKVFSMKDGTMLMVVENGLIWFEILPMMK
jgi:sarcosine oxidase delta subunit